MYYTVNDKTGMIVDASMNCPDPQEQADYFNCPIYIIKGEHSGLCATPRKPEIQEKVPINVTVANLPLSTYLYLW